MTALRNIYYDMPENIKVPQELQHRAVEVIMLPLEQEGIKQDFKLWLSGMPENIDDNLFERNNDNNEARAWLI